MLVPADSLRASRAQHRLLVADWSQQLVENQYVVLPSLVNEAFLSCLRRHYRNLAREGYLRHGDDQSPLRNVAHNEAVSRFIHLQLVPLVARVARQRLMASYSYLAVYKPGASLAYHTDREQCAWNLSVVLDADPELERGHAWPIFLEVSGRPRCVRLGVGDGVLYRGTRLPHWREPQPSGQTTTVCFFHFVDRTFRAGLS
jgi:hypothetical protein